MLSQIARIEFHNAGVNVSVVYPSVTTTEFHRKLRAGQLARGGRTIPPDPPELAAAAVGYAIAAGQPHVLVADPPQPIDPGSNEAWGARQLLPAQERSSR